MAVDQYGQTEHGLEYPRRDLLERTGYSHAEKMYQDKKSGEVVHTGYVIGDRWFTLYNVEPFEVVCG
jgi:hypothetical protein